MDTLPVQEPRLPVRIDKGVANLRVTMDQAHHPAVVIRPHRPHPPDHPLAVSPELLGYRRPHGRVAEPQRPVLGAHHGSDELAQGKLARHAREVGLAGAPGPRVQLRELDYPRPHAGHRPRAQRVAERVARRPDVLHHHDALAPGARWVGAAPVGGDEPEPWDQRRDVVVELCLETVDREEGGEHLQELGVEASLDAEAGRRELFGGAMALAVSHLDEDVGP